jgi:transcriptional regulator with XRE-family HTH domain
MGRAIAWAREAAEESEREAVAAEVSELVRASGLSRAEFASRIGTSASRLSTYTTGKVTPSAALLVRMRHAGTRTADEVHKMVLARRELNRWAKRAEAEATGELTSKHAPRPI